MASGYSKELPGDKPCLICYDDAMSRYSRKVRGWGALGDYTEHRNKQGNVTARTRYHEGKAITTRVPKRREYSTPAPRPGLVGTGLVGILSVAIGIVVVGAVIAGIVSVISSALVGFWPIARVIVSWLLMAGWAATVVHFILKSIDRFRYPNWVTWVRTVCEVPFIGLAGLAAFALVAVPDGEWNAVASAGFSGAFLIAPVLVVSVIVFAFLDTPKWLWSLLAALVGFIVLAVVGFAGPGFSVIALLLYLAVQTRFSNSLE